MKILAALPGRSTCFASNVTGIEDVHSVSVSVLDSIWKVTVIVDHVVLLNQGFTGTEFLSVKTNHLCLFFLIPII